MRKILTIGKYTMDGELLGCGNFGRVELATHTLTNVKVAVKIIDTRKFKTTYASRNLYREARILAQIRHPNIVRMYETLKASYLYCLVLEYVSNNDLQSYLKTLKGSKMSELEAWPLVRQLVSALVFLYYHSIVHRDLKLNNILLDEGNENIKIIDFGLSNMFVPGELLKTHCGSPEFAAPELFYDRHDYGPEVDAWSLGVIMYGMMVGKLPFTPGSTEPSKRHALLKMLNKGLTQEHKKQMVHLGLDCRGLLFQLIEPNPELRLSMLNTAAHDWVTREGFYPIEHDIEPEIDKPLQCKVVSKLAEVHQLDSEYIENHVSEYKYDGISSQYNMLMDRYSHLRRVQKITSPINRLQRKAKPSVPKPHAPCSSKMSRSPSCRMKAILNSDIKDDTFVESKALNTLRNKASLSDGLGKPIITVSTCAIDSEYEGGVPVPSPAQNKCTLSVNLQTQHHLAEDLDSSSTESMHKDTAQSSEPTTEDSPNQKTTMSTASTAVLHGLSEDIGLVSEEIIEQPLSLNAQHNISTDDSSSQMKESETADST